jgi:tetratricopeptide (TPR) repeat protein
MIPYVLALAATSWLAALTAAPTHREYQRDGIKLETDLSQAEVEEVFTLAIDTRLAADDLFEQLGLGRKSSRSLRIKLFAVDSEFEDYRRRTFDQRTKVRATSFFNDSDRIVAAAWQSGSEPARGELRGQIGRKMLLDFAKNPQPWLEEGIFGWFEALSTDAFGDVTSVANRFRIQQMRAAFERRNEVPLFELMQLREPQYYGLAGGKSDAQYPREILYAESWALFLFLAQSKEPQDQKLFQALGEWLDTGRWSQATFERALDDVAPRFRAFVFDDTIFALGDALDDAWTALEQGDARRARQSAATALHLDPENASGHRALGHAGLDGGDLKAAVASFEWILEHDPGDADAAFGLARARFLRGKENAQDGEISAALAGARAAAERLPANQRYRAYLLAAEIEQHRGDARATLKQVREARKQPGLPKAVDDRLAAWEDELVRGIIK